MQHSGRGRRGGNVHSVCDVARNVLLGQRGNMGRYSNRFGWGCWVKDFPYRAHCGFSTTQHNTTPLRLQSVHCCNFPANVKIAHAQRHRGAAACVFTSFPTRRAPSSFWARSSSCRRRCRNLLNTTPVAANCWLSIIASESGLRGGAPGCDPRSSSASKMGCCLARVASTAATLGMTSTAGDSAGVPCPTNKTPTRTNTTEGYGNNPDGIRSSLNV